MSDSPNDTAVPEELPEPGAREPRGKKPEILPAEADEVILRAAESLDEQAKKELTPENFRLLQFIAQAIGKDGMTVQESCMLANIEYEKLTALAQAKPIVAQIIRVKELEYKRSLMKGLSTRARSGDDKIATMLLASRWPEEFGNKKRGGAGDEGEDMMRQAVDFIQENGDSYSLIRPQTVGAVQRRDERTINGVQESARALEGFLV